MTVSDMFVSFKGPVRLKQDKLGPLLSLSGSSAVTAVEFKLPEASSAARLVGVQAHLSLLTGIFVKKFN